jgi:RNA polymerase sigma factor (sigma-70 family)
MTNVQLIPARRSICKAGPRAAELSDGQLLAAFSADNDHGAFTQIVRRHGPAVFGVCRRVLQHVQDAEDAFQATFLVLAGKPGSVRRGESLAGWLHGVAYRVAMRAKRDAARRRRHEQRVPPALPAPASRVMDWREVQAVLDEEVERLPPAYRDAFVLCCLSGLSQADTARRLGIQEGTVSSRLTRARQRLQAALTRRDLTLTAVLSALALTGGTQAAVPETLAEATARAASGEATHGLSAQVLTLAEGAFQTMFAARMKLVMILVLALGLLAASPGWRGTPASLSMLGVLHQQDASALAQAAPEPQAKQPARSLPPVKAGARPKKSETVLVAGRVLGPDGKPVGGAKVFFHTKGKSKEGTRTGADGRFRLEVSKAEIEGRGQVVASVAGLGPDWLRLRGRPDLKDITLHLVKDDLPISGRILDLEGMPIAGLSVEVASLEARVNGGDLNPWIETKKKWAKGDYVHGVAVKTLPAQALGVPEVSTDKEGRFRLTGFGRERVVHLRVRGQGIENLRLEVLTRSGPLPNLKTNHTSGVYPARFEHLAAPGKSIAGIVRDKRTRKPLAGIQVKGASGKFIGTGFEVQAVTDENGRYELTGLSKQQEYWVAADGRDYFNSTQFHIRDTPGLEPVTVDFDLERGLIVRGRLTDQASGKPVPGQLSYVAAADNPNLKDYTELGKLHVLVSRNSPRGEVGPDGSFTILTIPGPGMLCVKADDATHYVAAVDTMEDWDGSLLKGIPNGLHPSQFHAVVQINPSRNDPRSLICDIAVEPGRTRTGKVVGPDGKPLAGVHVAGLTPLPQFEHLTQVKPTRREGLKGATFTALGLSPRKGRAVVFFHPEKKLGKVERIRGDGADPVTVKLEPLGSGTGRVLDSKGRPWVGLTVRAELTRQIAAYKDLPWELLTNMGDTMVVEAPTDREGRFKLDGLLEGLHYTLIVSEGAFKAGVRIPYYRKNVTVESGKAKDLGDLKSRLAPEEKKE